MEKIDNLVQWRKEMITRFGFNNMNIVDSKSDNRIMIFLNGQYNENILIGKFDNDSQVGHIYDRRKSKRTSQNEIKSIKYDELSLEEL